MADPSIVLDGGTVVILLKIARDLGGLTNQVATNSEEIDEVKRVIPTVSE